MLASLDENIIDFESRKVKERRAHDEVSSGKYRHPNFIARKYLFQYSNNMFLGFFEKKIDCVLE